ncbi:hypothetical protein [Flavobacterium cerinum]|uniref:Uncharacterized protein n=1 Tax=Flavobacterium cerinum TaxID=2502784 RepID=A0ABY5IRX4_9FLAO|nr:hypothetical protein [Flavobacterium cerinum]UUC45026.1 hypothetical protein NOX80_15525 [Flavobacterium cerinum]
MALLKKHEVRDNGNNTFDLLITFPDNCSYSYSFDSATSKNHIDIVLSMSQKPSSNYITRNETVTPYNDQLKIDVSQTQDGVTATKPKIIIEI